MNRRGRTTAPVATVTRKDHKEGAHPLQGSDERRVVLARRCMELKMRGYNSIETAQAVHEEFNLEKEPPSSTVRYWIAEAMAEQQEKLAEMTQAYILTFKMRADAIIKNLIPFALDDFHVKRTKVRDGCDVTVIDEDVLKERIAAAAEIRKQGESVLKALGVHKPSNAQEGDGSPESVKMFILSAITNHMAKDGDVISKEKSLKVLELCSGDPIIDAL